MKEFTALQGQRQKCRYVCPSVSAENPICAVYFKDIHAYTVLGF